VNDRVVDTHSEAGNGWDHPPRCLSGTLGNIQGGRVISSTSFHRTSFVRLHLHLASAPLEGTVCLGMKFLSLNHFFPLSLLFLLYSTSFSLRRVSFPFVDCVFV
jgi:hypothetical protein